MLFISRLTMDNIVKFLIVFSATILNVSATTYTVKVGTENHINEIDPKFLSFTVDPKYLFPRSARFKERDSVCMATSLAPAYLRIAGPSTSHLVFRNASITFTDLRETEDSSNFDHIFRTSKEKLSSYYKNGSLRNGQILKTEDVDLEMSNLKSRSIWKSDMESREQLLRERTRRLARGLKRKGNQMQKENPDQLTISESQWTRFASWAKDTGFELVFALNNEEKMSSGLWDPNAALNFLTLALKENVSDVYWQLGYECRNQTIDEYLNDLETLNAIVESFEAPRWRTVGGDVTRCLRHHSKSDFRDYIALSEDMMHAVVMNGNSSAYELARMSEHDRHELLKLLSNSSTPLWLVDISDSSYSELHRAADWINSLGYSARNGFSVHFRELVEQELYEPTLSFYLALLFKHLVGSRVLDVHMEGVDGVLFAHCTALHHKPMPGAVTFYGANMGADTARFAVKLSKREDGGEIMQFIVSQDDHGVITMNGRPITDTAIRPVIKHVRPYKTLLLNLPPRSFGFWVIGNTKITACHDAPDTEEQVFLEAVPVEGDYFAPGTAKTKRSMIEDVSKETLVKEGFRDRLNEINFNLRNINKVFNKKEKNATLRRRKREIENETIESAKRKLRKFVKKFRDDDEPKPRLDFLRKIFGLTPRSESSRVRRDKVRKVSKGDKYNVHKRNAKYAKDTSTAESKRSTLDGNDISNLHNRSRRSIVPTDKVENKKVKDLSENDIDEIDAELEHEMKLWKILHRIHKQVKDLDVDEKFDNIEDNSSKEFNKLNKKYKDLEKEDRYKHMDSIDSKENKIVFKSDDDTATIKVKDNKHGLLKSTVNKLVSVLTDLNSNLNKFWSAITLLD